MKKISLHQNWQYRQAAKDGAWRNANVPGNIHLDLIADKTIPDPYYRTNEREQQWIGEVDWEYRTQFFLHDDVVNSGHIDLVFEGLDTYADVYLNGVLILQSDNMYCGWRVNAKPRLKSGSNELRIYFHSVIKKTLPLFEQNGFEYGANNSQPEPKLSMYTRKPGYHFGWDWGPRLLTCGVWRPVFLEAWDDVRLDNVRFVQKSLSDDAAKLQLEVELVASTNTAVEMNLTNSLNAFSPVQKNAEVRVGHNKLKIDFEIASPKKWWCNGLGEAHLYDLKLDISSEKNPVGAWQERVGLRTIELVHEEDEKGKSFYFKINGVPIFIKGANCIPADYFIPRVKEEDYRKLLENAVSANMNMLRLWGGAVYEEKTFYDLCDEMGILVWQDFMFACAMYPADAVMARRIRQEAEYNVKRLRNHASLALWCGNNEIDEGWHCWGWQQRYNYTPETCDKIWEYYRAIFHEILPEAVKQFDPERAYWPSSPKFGFTDPRSLTDGDMHYWGVWFLNHSKEKFKEYLPRFMSEYGLQSMPEIETLRAFSTPEDWDLKSDVMQAHQRQYPNPRKGQMLGGYDMLLRYLENEYHVPDDFELLAYVSQLLQADYLRYAIETHRRSRPYCMGTMYWQLNDLWPVTSWSTIDYYGRWKAAHYAVQQAYRPLLASTTDEGDDLKVFVVNDSLQQKTAILDAQLMNFAGKITFHKQIEIELPPSSSQTYFEIEKNDLLHGMNFENLVWITRLAVPGEQPVENLFYFTFPNRFMLDDPEIDHSIERINGQYQIKLRAKRLAKNVKIQTPDSGGIFSDNYFDLLPGREKVVSYKPDGEWNKRIDFLHYYLVLMNAKENRQ